MKQIKGGVTAPKGFMAAGVEAGVKYKNRRDMALIYSETPCVAAGVFTSNLVKAAPVIWDREIVESKTPVHGVIVNSGIANACTGKEGYAYCQRTAEEAGKVLGVRADSILVASTGVIGMQLDMEKIVTGVSLLAGTKASTLEAGDDAACAIMTTDTVDKQAAVTVEIGGRTVTVGGMCKGSGMIHPNMCTMLGFITTDVCITKELLQEALSADVQDTFNMISVDGDTSTNDTLLVLANGQAQNPVIDKKGEEYDTFVEALHAVDETLAKKMAKDGEGATVLFEARVIHGSNKEQVKTLAKSVICSNLTKAAIYGHDANWGRILCAMGYSGANFDPDRTTLYFESEAGKILIFKDGKAAGFSEEKASEILSGSHIKVIADIGEGDCEASAWGCDLTCDYVKINADYRS